MRASRDPATTIGGVDTPAAGFDIDNRIVWPTGVPAGTQDGVGIVDIVLEGGPEHLPDDLRTLRAPIREPKIKVRHNGGYEHFECDAIAPDGAPTAHGPVVFRWTGRTRIAE